MDPETREYLDGLRVELAAIRRDIATKHELAALDAKIDRVVQVMAEGIVMNAEALTRFHAELR